MQDFCDVKQNMFEDVDCVHLRVVSLDEGLNFYRDKLGLRLIWRTDMACGLGTRSGSTEIVLSTEDLIMVDMRVENVRQALREFLVAGGTIEEGPFSIDIGECAVVADPFGNKYCILDTTNGTYDTAADGLVEGVSKKQETAN